MTDQAEKLIRECISDFVELYGASSISLKFHSMRHLAEQGRRVGPVWCFTAFSFEYAHYQLMSALSGPVRTCQHMFECYVKHKVAFELKNRRLHANPWQELDNFSLFTKVSIECLLFCSDMREISFYGRYRSRCGKIFASQSYRNLSGNISECIAQMSDSTFGQIETFVERQGKFSAIIRHFLSTENMLLMSECNRFFSSLGKLGDFQEVDIEDLRFKSVFLDDDN